MFQDGIQPMWEDDRNKKGGRWLINLNKQQRHTDLDNFWLETVSFIGILTEEYEIICYRKPCAAGR